MENPTSVNFSMTNGKGRDFLIGMMVECTTANGRMVNSTVKVYFTKRTATDVKEYGRRAET